MDDREFLDHLYQMWSKTSNADKAFWKITEDEKHILVDIDSVDQNGWEQTIAFGVYEKDADWITAVHGCFPDLIRRFHEALDEADRLDREMDEVQARLAEAYIRVMELEQELNDAKQG